MTIHETHPFPAPDDPVRRLRGRLGGAVSLWTAGTGSEAGEAGEVGDRAGLTVTSLMVAAGDPARVLGLIDPDSDLLELLEQTGTCVVQLLAGRHQQLADAFAGQSPAPGGPFRMTEVVDTGWGPRLADADTWAGVRLEGTTTVGWSTLVTCTVEEIVIGEDDQPLFHRRGRYARG